MHATSIGWISTLTFALLAGAATESRLEQTDVFAAGKNGYHTFRIPAIEAAPDGALIAFAEARKYSADDPGFGKQEIDLVYKRSTDNGATWSAMKTLEAPGTLWSAANPATLVDRQQGQVWVFYIRSRPERSTDTARPGTDDMQTLARWSADNGQTWSEPMDLTSVARDMHDLHWRASVPGPGGAIQTRTGRLLVPMWKMPFADFAIFSDDHGKTWQRGEPVPGTQGGDENQLVELADRRILMDIRQNTGRNRWFAESKDGGKTWGEVRAGLNVTPVACAIERYTLRAAGEDRDRLVWTGPMGPDRKQLVIRTSYDEGRSFTNQQVISEQFAAYSDLTILKDKSIGVLWERGAERGYESITFTRLKREFLEPKAIDGQTSNGEGGEGRVASATRFQQACGELGLATNRMLVGFATSMEKLLPREASFAVRPAREVEISLARNEKESFQVAVLPLHQAVQAVTVKVSDLKSPAGDVLTRTAINCDVVGYVETKKKPPYDVTHVGWWPDPILDFPGPVDIAAGDLQAFWVRVRAPKGQPAGVYQGTLTVAAKDVAPQVFRLTVRVYGFTLPDQSPLPLAITFFEHPEQMGGEANWAKRRFDYADFLADYYINYDSLYRAGPPDFEIVKHLHDRGRLVAFNLGNVFNDGAPKEGLEQAVSNTVARLRGAYEKAKEYGLLDHAYIYGFDERGKEQFPLLEKCAQELRKAFPEVQLMTTSYDQSYGLDSGVKTIDAWCPLTPSFDREQARKARAAGRQVWWYICCGPQHPHANMFVEYPAIEGRLLMGAMTAKERPDGFLYYSLTIWNQNAPIETGPFTKWNPVSWTTYDGDGSWFCSGPGGKPVPTIRLENFRDGLEDFAYACILQALIRAREGTGAALSAQERQWLIEAKAALPVPESLVRSMKEYSRDSAELYAWRNRIGELIERGGAGEVNPWGSEFGVRGFSALAK
jgi:hypothetical protein